MYPASGLRIHIYRSSFFDGPAEHGKTLGFFSLSARFAYSNSKLTFVIFVPGNLDGDSVPHPHGTHKILDFGYLAPHECVRSRTPTAYRELLRNYKMQEDHTMARPKKDENIKRTKNVMVRFTDVEYALVSCSAEQAGYPVAVYVRKQAITEKLHVHYNIVADIAELRDFARQLSHIGNNLNQIAAFFNSGGIQSRAMLEEINRCMTDLRSMRKDIAELAGDYRGNLKTRRR